MKTIKLTIELRWKLEYNFVGCLFKNRLDMKLKSILLYFNIRQRGDSISCAALVIHSIPTVSTIRPTVIHTLSFPSSLSHGYDNAYVNKHGQRKRERERHQEFQLGLWELYTTTVCDARSARI